MVFAEKFHFGQNEGKIKRQIKGVKTSQEKGRVMDKKWCKFCEQWLEDSPDILTVLEIKAITGYCKTSVQGWIDRGLIKAFLTGRSNKIPKSSLLEFMSSSKFYNMHVKSKKLKAKLQEFERMIDNEN